MSREVMQQALEALERYQVKRQDFDRFADEIDALRAALAAPAAPSVPASQWIACSEQLPDADIEVLAFADEAMYLAVYEPDGWWSSGRGYMLHRVTHWMHLPGEPEC